MPDSSSKDFNKALVLIILSVALIVTIKLVATASGTDNWRGFLYSFLHVAVVAAGSYLGLKRPHNEGKTLL